MKTFSSERTRFAPRPIGLHRLWPSGLMTVVIALVLVGFATPAASGSTVGAGIEAGHGAGAVQPVKALAASLVAGYYATPAHAFASASATFVVPKVTCSSATTVEAFGLFNDNPTTNDVVTVVAAVLADCTGGVASYDYDAYQSGEGTAEPGVKAGDTVEASIYQTGDIEEAKVFDITASHYWDAYDTPIPDTSMMIGEYSTAPQQTAKVSLSQVQVNGQYLSFEPSTKYNLVDGSTTLVKTSAVPPDGDSFSLTFEQTERDAAAATAASEGTAIALAGTAPARADIAGTDGGAATSTVTPDETQASSIFAGYDSTPSHAFASASATFVVPTVTCPTHSPIAANEWFGLTDSNTTSYDDSVIAAVVAVCSDDVPVSYYYTAQVGNEQISGATVNAGDTVEVSVYQTGSIEEAKVFDITQNHYWDAYTSPVPDTSMAIGLQTGVPVSPFTKASFSQVQVNGQYLSFEPSVRYNLLENSTTLVSSSAVPGDGDSFSLKFKTTG